LGSPTLDKLVYSSGTGTKTTRGIFRGSLARWLACLSVAAARLSRRSTTALPRLLETLRISIHERERFGESERDSA